MATIAETFDLALRHHQAGDLLGAEKLYRQILQDEPVHADAHHLLGVLAYQHGHWDQAVDAFRDAIALNPSSPEYHNNLGLALHASGLPDEALGSYQEALLLQPHMAEAHNNSGIVLLKQGRLQDAETQFQWALQIKPNYASAHSGLALALVAQGRQTEAASCFKRALELNPNDAESFQNLANLHYHQGRSNEALACCRRAVMLQPTFVEAHLTLGKIHLLRQSWVESESSFRNAIGCQPDYAEAHLGLGLVLDRQNRHAEALACYRHASKLRPDSAEIQNDLGNALVIANQIDDALECYRRAIQLKRDFPATWNNQGSALARQGKLAESVTSLREALRLQPDFVEAHSNLANILLRQGQAPEAVAASQEAIRIAPNHAPAHFLLGAALQALDHLDEAKASFERAVQLQPDYAEAHHGLGNIHFEQCDFEQTLSSYRGAVEYMPDFAEAHGNLGALLAEMGDLAAAEMHLSEAIRHHPAARFQIMHAALLPPIYQSAEEVLVWRQRLIDNIRRLQEDGITVDVTNELALPAFYSVYQGLNDRDLQRDLARLYSLPQSSKALPLSASPRADQRIHIGFISRFFKEHTVGHWIRGLVAQLARDKFEVTVINIGNHDDAIAQFFKRHADHSVQLPSHLPSARTAITELQLDVLLYPDIGMEPMTYTLAMSRLAPVQCATLGHPVTTGIDTIDYFISSEALETESSAEHYTEKLVRLKNLPIYFYKPPAPSRTMSREQFHLTLNDHVYACLQSPFKLHPDFDDVLGGILRGDTKGIVLLSAGRMPDWEVQLRRRFSVTLSEAVNRIRFLPSMSFDVYLNLLALSDVQLDTTPFGGGSTSYEAISVGTPIVTMPSSMLRGRITFALYKQMNMFECVVKSPQEYVTKSLQLGNVPKYRENLRAKILAANSVLFENSAGVRELEQFLQEAVANSRLDADTPADRGRGRGI